MFVVQVEVAQGRPRHVLRRDGHAERDGHADGCIHGHEPPCFHPIRVSPLPAARGDARGNCASTRLLERRWVADSRAAPAQALPPGWGPPTRVVWSTGAPARSWPQTSLPTSRLPSVAAARWRGVHSDRAAGPAGGRHAEVAASRVSFMICHRVVVCPRRRRVRGHTAPVRSRNLDLREPAPPLAPGAG